MRTKWMVWGGVLVLSAVGATTAQAAAILFETSGASAAAIQPTVDGFRSSIGGLNNGNAPGPLADGRREINWDGGGSTTTSTAGSTFTGFQTTRGGLFTTSGTGFLQSPLTETVPTDITLGDALGNPALDAAFSTFSPLRVFTPVDANVMDATFFIPGTLEAAGVSAFGAVFTGVDIFGPTRIDFYGPGDTLLLSRSVLTGALSFLGVSFDSGELITRARIFTGTAALTVGGAGDIPADFRDVVAMDDFIYAEPEALPSAVPEPASLTLLGLGAAGVARAVRRRRLSSSD
jgi:hypothetical protein